MIPEETDIRAPKRNLKLVTSVKSAGLMKTARFVSGGAGLSRSSLTRRNYFGCNNNAIVC